MRKVDALCLDSFACLAFGVCPARNGVPKKSDSILIRLSQEEVLATNFLISEKAKMIYEKSLQLNPNNEDGKGMLEQIRGEKP